MNQRSLFAILVLLASTSSVAQVNDKGTFHASIGIAAGGHATHYRQTLTILGVPFTSSDDDGAATVTYPIQVGYGFANVFSLGLLIEPGSYLDSNATRSNSLVLVALEPRFYLVNHDRFAWTASLQFGSSTLHIDDQGATHDRTVYRGSNFGIGSSVGFYFTDHIGMQIHARYLATAMPLKEFESNGNGISLDNFKAELRTGGVALQASLAFKF